MRRNGLLGLLAAALVLLMVLAVPSGAVAAPAPTTGTVRVYIVTPKGVPATVDLVGSSTLAAAKPPAGATATVTLAVPAGTYQVRRHDVMANGRLHQATGNPQTLNVRAGWTTNVTAVYLPDRGAYDLRTVGITEEAISLAWSAPRSSTVSLRRTEGDVPVTQRTHGTAVPVSGSSASDRGLKPGTTYSYSLFTKLGNRWYGPVTVTAGTAAPAGSTAAAYIAPATTLLAAPADVTSTVPTGTGVRIALADQVPSRVIGSAVVLPQSDVLPGGFLGVVTGLSGGGRTVDLTAGGLSDAFDFYSLAIPEFAGEPEDVGPAGFLPNAKVAPGAQPETEATPLPSERTPADPRPSTVPAPMPQGKVGPSAAALGSCNSSAQGPRLTFTPKISLGGSFNATINKYSVFGQSIPTGASMNMALTDTVSGAAAVETNASWGCSLGLKPTTMTLTTTPVPLSFHFQPTAEFAVSGAVKVGNVGVTATAGVQFSGSLGINGSASFSGSPIFKASPLTPQITANGQIEATLGGQVVVGPGAGTPNAGVLAGVGGDLYPIDASFGAVFAASDARFNTCMKAHAAATANLNLTGRAWLGNWEVSKKITFDALSWEKNYPGSPWSLPSGCENGPPPVQPGNDVLGPGVTKVSDSVVGGSTQWGHVEGFAPGSKTWVLSTGRIGDAVGSPDQVASTDLLAPGDSALGALAGGNSYDAAAYQVTLIPTGTTLHVRYVFASEEYPEFVGSQFNDVMAVFVDGVNCAVVPGTSEPVAVNTVNAGHNGAFYVDNTQGASGYATSMDGLTVPMNCSVPVVPGKPVTVRIAVADTGDAILDSAVALLDKGIWTD
jgi:hypothetical protein